IQVDAARWGLSDVALNLASGAMALDGGGNFAGGQMQAGIESANMYVDGLVFLSVQPIPDINGADIGTLLGTSAGGGLVEDFGTYKKLTLDVTFPIQFQLGGLLVDGTAAGVIVA